MTPAVSAVIPTYNRRSAVPAAIASALCQTHRLHEIIVVDDGSTDGTWGDLQALAAKEHATRVVTRWQENAGPSAARNSGLRLASGDFVAFLDSDDVWHENKTARQLAVFAAHPELALVGCVIEGMNVFPGRHIVPVDIEGLLFRNYFLTPGVMVRREVLLASGGFAEDMTRCEDYDLWLRIAEAHACALLNEVLMTCAGGKRTFGSSGLSGSLWAIQAGELETFRRWRARGGASLGYRRALAISWLRFARRMFLVAFDALRAAR